MQKSILAAMILALGVVACGKKEEAKAPAPAPAAADKSLPMQHLLQHPQRLPLPPRSNS